MSNLRVAFVAEGPTDIELILAALQAILPGRSFIPTRIQPEQTFRGWAPAGVACSTGVVHLPSALARAWRWIRRCPASISS
jgi:hypothetical protein